MNDHLFNYGVLGVLVSFVMYGSLRIVKWMGPYIARVFEAHIGLMNGLKESQHIQTELLTAISSDVKVVKEKVLKDTSDGEVAIPASAS